MDIEDLDEMDNKILEVIKDNARLSYSEISTRVGLSRVSVRTRMNALEKKGVIQGYKTVINSSAASPDGFPFVLNLEVCHDKINEVNNILIANRKIKNVYLMSGTDHIMATGRASSKENVNLIVRELYRDDGREYIKKLEWEFVLDSVKG